MTAVATEWPALLAAARSAWEDGRWHEALQLCDRAALAGTDGRRQAALLRGDILLECGDAAGALSSFDSVAHPADVDAELDCARGLALFELARLAEAENALQSALRGNDRQAAAHYGLGLIYELLGNGQEVAYFRQARRLAPDRYPAAPRLAAATFAALVEQAAGLLPPLLQEAMRRLPVLVTELPHPADLRRQEPPLSPQVLGMHVAVHAGPSEDTYAGAQEQPAVLLFKRNLERACPEREALVAEIRATLQHELSALLGLQEGALEGQLPSSAATGTAAAVEPAPALKAETETEPQAERPARALVAVPSPKAREP